MPDLNVRLGLRLKLGLTWPLQKSFPHVHGLYLLLRALGLTLLAGTDRKTPLIVDGAVHHMWDELKLTEQYCTLLETWLTRGQISCRNRFGVKARFSIPTCTDSRSCLCPSEAKGASSPWPNGRALEVGEENDDELQCTPPAPSIPDSSYPDNRLLVLGMKAYPHHSRTASVCRA